MNLHCVVQSLQSSLDIELLELKCNVHPLDGIAKRCKDLLKVYDKEYNITSDIFGSERCCAVSFMYAMTKMRFKQGKGDPGGFRQFLRQEKIKPRIIVCYVGNRFHVVFHLAGVLYYLREKHLIYLDTSCRQRFFTRAPFKRVKLPTMSYTDRLTNLGLHSLDYCRVYFCYVFQDCEKPCGSGCISFFHINFSPYGTRRNSIKFSTLSSPHHKLFLSQSYTHLEHLT